jgi:hypothetical protein|tara:strand:- start:264 stop:437 length:174 start_codon:yes stop_codon:yes gene_type:complete
MKIICEIKLTNDLGTFTCYGVEDDTKELILNGRVLVRNGEVVNPNMQLNANVNDLLN